MPIPIYLLREVVADQQRLTLPSYAIVREQQAQISEYFRDNLITIISGLRRCGKSTLLQFLRKQHQPSDYYLNFDDERLAAFKLEDFQTLYELLIEMFGEQQHFYFDEIQNIMGWERFVRRLHDYGKKVWITGSNASMLSLELGTRLTGRYRQVELLPFSFREYLRFNQAETDDFNSSHGKALMKRYFHQYLLHGGIPAALHFQDPQYLSDLYEGILYRDVVARYHLTKVNEIKELAYHAASNIAKSFSYSKIKQLLSVRHTTTVRDYFYYLEQSYLLFLVAKFDFSTKRQILAPKKLYFVDTGLAQVVGFRSSPDYGRLLENVVYLELRRQGHKIYYYFDNKECDFLIHDANNQFQAIQVTMSLQDPIVMKRETLGLVAAMESLQLQQGWILTLDEEQELKIQHQNKTYLLQVMPIWKWLARSGGFI